MCTGLVLLGSIAATAAASAGTSLSTEQNVQLLFPLTALCTWSKVVVKILTASAILRDTVTASTKGKCVWDSGSVIVRLTPLATPTRDTFQCPGSLSKKFPRLRISSKQTTTLAHVKAFVKTVVE